MSSKARAAVRDFVLTFLQLYVSFSDVKSHVQFIFLLYFA